MLSKKVHRSRRNLKKERIATIHSLTHSIQLIRFGRLRVVIIVLILFMLLLMLLLLLLPALFCIYATADAAAADAVAITINNCDQEPCVAEV